MTATGFASLAVGMNFDGIGAQINKGLVAPMRKSAKKAGDEMEKTLVTSAVKAERAMAKARGTQEKATQNVTKAVNDLKKAEENVKVATDRKTAAEAEYEITVRNAAARVEAAEKKIVDLKESGKATTEQVKKAELDLANARDKATADVAKAEAKVEAARSKTRDATEKARQADLKLSDAKNRAEEAADQLRKAEKQLADSTDEAADSAEQAKGRFGGLGDMFEDLKGKVGPLGAALGGVLGAGALASAGMDTAEQLAKIQGQLGYTGAAADVLKDGMNEALRSGVASSAEEAAAAVGALESQFKYLGFEGEQTAGQLSDNFMAFAKTFDMDMTEATQTVGQLIQNNLATDVEQGLDLLTTSFRQVPAAMRDEIPEIINEYGTYFSSMGFSGEESFALIANSAQLGKIEMDKVGDAIKELGIRATDLGDSGAVEALDKIGLAGEDIQNKMLAGGDSAKQAFNDIVDGLLKIEDPAEQAEAAVALFGTPLEDLDKAKIPGFLNGLKNLEGGMGDVTGASQELADQIADSLPGRIDRLKGTVTSLAGEAFMAVWDAVENKIIPAFQGLGDKIREVGNWVEEHKLLLMGIATAVAPLLIPILIGLGAHWLTLGTKATISAGKQVAAWTLTKIEAAKAAAISILNLWKVGAGWIAAGAQAMIGAGRIAAAWLLAKAQSAGALIATLVSVGAQWITAGAKAMLGAAKMAAAWVVGLGPIAWVTAAIAAVVAGLTWFFTKTETGKQLLESFGETMSNLGSIISDAFSAAIEFCSNAISSIAQLVSDFVNSVVEFFVNLGSQIAAAVSSAFETVSSLFMSGIESIVSFVSSFPGKVLVFFAELSVQASQKASEIWNLVKSLFVTGLTNTVATVTTFPSRVIAFFQNLLTQASQKATEIWNNVRQKFTDGINRVMDVVRSFPDKIKGFFSGAGQWLVSAGQQIVEGLKSGIMSVTGWFADALRSILPDWVIKFVPGLEMGGLVEEMPGMAQGGLVESLPGFAAGGLLPTSGPGTNEVDGILGVSDQGVPVARVNAGEFVVNAEQTRKHLPLLRAINDGRIKPRVGDLGLPRYEKGGVVSFDQVMSFLKGNTVNGNPTPGAFSGSPYVWGGGLDGNWGDCSGFQSAVASLVAGVDTTGRKFATGSQGAWLQQNGFTRGRSNGKNAYEVGYFNGGPYGGHTSGSLFDSSGRETRIEMGGASSSGKINGAAVSARHSQFTDIWHRPLKGGSATGKVTNTSVKGVTTTDGKTETTTPWGKADSLFELAKKGIRVFDTGGLLRTGQLALNTSGRNEHVMTASQWDKLVDGLKKLAKAVEKGDFGYEAVEKALGKRAAKLTREATGGSLGGWVAETDLLKDAEKGLASVRSDSKASAKDIAAAELAVAQARKASEVKGFNNGSSLAAFAADASLADMADVAKQVGDLGKSFSNVFGQLSGGLGMLAGSASVMLSATAELEKSYTEQANANANVVAAEADLKLARKEGKAEDIKAAELALTDARSAAAAAAVATGHVEIATAIKVAGAVIDLIEQIATKIGEIIGSVFEGFAEGWDAVADMFDAMADVAGIVSDLRGEVTKLGIDYASAIIQVRNASREMRLVQLANRRSELEAVKGIAEAQAAFDKQRQHDMMLAAMAYDDLSLAYDRFRWNQMTSTELAMSDLAEWSDESHALYAELMAAQIGLQIVQAEGEKAALMAAYEHTLAMLDLRDVSNDLQNAAAKLAVASGAAFGTNQVSATVNQRYAQLAAEEAEIMARRADAKTWLNPVNTFGKLFGVGYYSESERRLKQIQAEKAALEARDEFSIDGELKAEIQRVINGAVAQGFFGGADQIAETIRLSAIGDAARILDQINFEASLIDLKAEQDALKSEIDRGVAKLENEQALTRLETMLASLGLARDSEKSWAEYWRTDDARVREALAALAKAQSDDAATIKQMADEPSVVQLPKGKSAYSVEEVERLVKELGGRIERLESPMITGADVLMSRR